MAKFHYFLWLGIVPLCVCVHAHISHLYSSVDGHFSWFHIFTMKNDATISIGVHVCFQISVFIFFRHIPRDAITESYSSYIFSNLSTIIHNGYNNLHSYQQCTCVPFSPCPCQHFLFSFILWYIKFLLISWPTITWKSRFLYSLNRTGRNWQLCFYTARNLQKMNRASHLIFYSPIRALQFFQYV